MSGLKLEELYPCSSKLKLILQRKIRETPGIDFDPVPGLTLVLRGGRSDYLQPEMAKEMARLNPRIQWREIADAGHYVHDDQPQAFCQEVREFLCNPAV